MAGLHTGTLLPPICSALSFLAQDPLLAFRRPVPPSCTLRTCPKLLPSSGRSPKLPDDFGLQRTAHHFVSSAELELLDIDWQLSYFSEKPKTGLRSGAPMSLESKRNQLLARVSFVFFPFCTATSLPVFTASRTLCRCISRGRMPHCDIDPSATLVGGILDV